MSGGRKTSIKTYRETSGTLLGTEYTSYKVYQIEDCFGVFFAILLHFVLTQAEKETLKTVKAAVTAISISLQDNWMQQYSIKYLLKNNPWTGTCEEPLQLITLKQSESFGLSSMTICSYKYSFLFYFQSNTALKENFQSERCCPPFLPLWCHVF